MRTPFDDFVTKSIIGQQNADERLRHLENRMGGFRKLRRQMLPQGTVGANSYTVNQYDTYIGWCGGTASLGGTIQFPGPGTPEMGGGRLVIIKDEAGSAASFPMLIEGTSTQSFDGIGSVKLDVNYGAIGVVSNGTTWQVAFRDPPYIFGTAKFGGSVSIKEGLYVGGTTSSNTKCTQGITVNQGANDNHVADFKSSDVAHGRTSYAETDTFGYAEKCEANAGGLHLVGLKDADAGNYAALGLTGILNEVANTTKSTAGIGIVNIVGAIGDVTTMATNAGADANLVSIRNYDTTRFIFDAEGSAHADVEWIAFDEHDDAAILDSLQVFSSLKANFGDFLKYNRADLERLGIAHFDSKPGHAMINFTKLSMLLTGALKQAYQRIDKIEQRLDRLLERG